MSLAHCHAAAHGHHNFQRTDRALVCKWCGMSREQIKQQTQQIAATHLAQARASTALTPEQIAELDKLKPYQERRRRLATLLAALENVAAFQFDKLPAPVPADARADVAAALAHLEKALAGISNTDIREALNLARCLVEANLSHMQARYEAFQRRHQGVAA